MDSVCVCVGGLGVGWLVRCGYGCCGWCCFGVCIVVGLVGVVVGGIGVVGLVFC